MASRSEENSPYGRLDEEVEPRHVGKRLDTVLAELTQKSRSYVASLIKSGKAGIKNRIRVAPSTKLKPGDRIFAEWRLSEPPIEAHPIELSVAYEDEDLAVVEKPAGIAVHPGAGSEDLTLASALLARWPEIRGVGDPSRPGIVHRLDADVSGLLIVARRREAYDCLVRDFSARAVERKYLALVSGRLEADIGRIEGPIGRDPSDPTKRAVVLGGKPAATTYTRLAVWSGVTLAEVGLETGRTHQIRVHMQAIGHPIVGDPYYGGGSALRSRSATPASILRLKRPFLHARRLAFRHPRTGERMEFESALPQDLEEVLQALGPPSEGSLKGVLDDRG